MITRGCPIHRVPLKMGPVQSRSRWPNWRYMTYHLRFEECPECGRRLRIEAPEPLEQCPVCEPVERSTYEAVP